MGLKDHYLGVNNIYNMSSAAEAKLAWTTYNGEGRRWNFERFVRLHVDQHHILEGLVEHGYAGIDERSKVRHLLDGIKTKELDVVRTRILSDAALRNDFDQCVNLYQDFINQRQATQREANLSSMIKEKQDARKKNQIPTDDTMDADMTIADRYY